MPTFRTAVAKPESWTVRELADARSGAGGRTLVVPRFQRSIVWPPSKREKLIDSLLKGYPIGSMLLHESGTATNRRYRLIDGLQRTTTLLEHLENPLAGGNDELIDDEMLTGLVQVILDEEPDEQMLKASRGGVKHWMQRTEGTEAQSFTGFAITKDLAEALNVEVSFSDQADEASKVVLDHLKAVLDISDVQIPVVIFRGNEEDLPEIFERLNTQGTKLSRYEVFAATWSDRSLTQISNGAVRQAIDRKYEDLVEEGFQLSEFSPGSPITDYTLFEYLFGLGKVIADRHPLLFGSSRDVTDVEPAAFSLVTLITGTQLADMKDLPDRMPRSGDRIDPSEMETALLESIEFVASLLEPYLKFQQIDGGRAAFTGRRITSRPITSTRKTFQAHSWASFSRTLKTSFAAEFLTGTSRNAFERWPCGGCAARGDA